jgi:hypothetical protein
MRNDPAIKNVLQSDSIQERCAHMSGSLFAGISPLASMTYVDTTGQSNQCTCFAPWESRPLSYRDVVP